MSRYIALASCPRIAPAPVRARSSAAPAQVRRALSGPGPRRNHTAARVATDAASASSSAADDAVDDPNPGIDTNGVDLDEFEQFVMSMQADFIADMEALDGSEDRKFGLDAWVRGEPGSGFGVTRVLEGGDVFEKAAANVSIIRGVLTPERAKAMSSRGRDCVDPAGGQPYSAAALSVVIHPKSPMVPTFRADVRRFTVAGTSWFGGGADLTPYYLFEEDAREFHSHWRRVCDAHDPTLAISGKAKKGSDADAGAKQDKKGFLAALFGRGSTQDRPKTDSNPREDEEAAMTTSAGVGGPLHEMCKRWCDDYFYIPARGEHRGVGGVFFDDLQSSDVPLAHDPSEVPTAKTPRRDHAPRAADAEAFTRAVAQHWTKSYEPIVNRRKVEPYGETQMTWHQQRRGRYVEFNLLYDRGVRFGLDGGRVESIMVSAPPRVRWDYDAVPADGSPEAALVEVLRNPRDW